MNFLKNKESDFKHYKLSLVTLFERSLKLCHISFIFHDRRKRKKAV